MTAITLILAQSAATAASGAVTTHSEQKTGKKSGLVELAHSLRVPWDCVREQTTETGMESLDQESSFFGSALADDVEATEAVDDLHLAPEGPSESTFIGENVDKNRHEVISDLFIKHHRNLVSFIARRIGNPDDAHDIVQHAFMEAYRSHARFRGDSNLKTWLYGITLNIMRNHMIRSPWRQHQSLDDAEAAAIPDSMPSQFDAYHAQEDMARVMKAMDHAPEDQRETLCLVAFDGLSYEEAAAQLGVAVGTVRSRVSRLRATLREVRA